MQLVRSGSFRLFDRIFLERTFNLLRKILLSLPILLLASELFAQAENPDAITGIWVMPNNDGVIEIFKSGSVYNGKIVWLKEREENGDLLKDKNNPVDSLKNKPLVGKQIINGFDYRGENLWSGGTFYVAKKGKTVEPDFILKDNNHLILKISFLFFSKSIELVRGDSTNFLNEIKEENPYENFN